MFVFNKDLFGELSPVYLIAKLLTEGSNNRIDVTYYDVAGLIAGVLAGNALIGLRGGFTPADWRRMADNVGALTQLNPGQAPEGSFVTVTPWGDEPIVLHKTITDFLTYRNRQAPDLKTIAVSGVGSSALGSAALAWSVANGLNEPVAAIVAGCGMNDWISEGVGGYYGLGLSATIRPHLHAALWSRGGAPIPPEGIFSPGDPDTNTLHQLLLSDDTHEITRFVGHSKGCLSIEAALQGVPKQRRQGIKLLNFGCAVPKPAGIGEITQFVGLFDRLGLRNCWGNQADAYPFSTHTTNPWRPDAMPVTALTALMRLMKRL